jgi:hypothetical protein
MFVFVSFNFRQYLIVFLGFLESFAFHRSHIVEFGLESFLCSIYLVILLSDFLVRSIDIDIHFLCLFAQLLLFSLDFHQSPSIIIIILLQFLQFSAFFEQCL